jgi:hypothetical protein
MIRTSGYRFSEKIRLRVKAAERNICIAIAELPGSFAPAERANDFKNSGYASPKIVTL